MKNWKSLRIGKGQSPDRIKMTKEQGFLLTAESLDIKGQCELHFYGKGLQGPFKIIYSNHNPLFFINRESTPILDGLVARKQVDLRNFQDKPVDALYFPSLDSFYSHRRQFKEQHIKLFESDIRAEDRFLMERHVKSGVEIEGNFTVEDNINVFREPRIKGLDFRPVLTWLSFDIETGRDGTLYSVSFYLTGKEEQRKVIIRGEAATDPPPWLEYCPDEQSLLKRFIQLVRQFDPDLLIGWHVIGFDLKFLFDRALKLGVRLNLGRGGREVRIIEKRNGLFAVNLEGRIVVDGPQTLRTAFYKFENFKLETVAQELLGRGKDITPEKDKVAEIERRFREDKEALAFYNLEDSVLVTEIFQKTGIIDQLITRSLITGLPVDKVHMSVAAFDFFMLPLIHRKGFVAPDTADMEPGPHAAGGHVFSSDAGLYKHVIVLDFKSLYPTIIRTFFIDPLSRLKSDIDTCTTPVGINFSRSTHILPGFLTELMGKRAVAKQKGDQYLAQAVKILMNSFYGVMGTTGCRFYHADLPTAITGTGQWILKHSASFLRESGYQVIYGDTDSVFVCLKEEEYENPLKAGERLERSVNHYFSDLIREKFDLESQLEIELEKHYTKFFLPPMRNSREGARKRYSGLLDNGEMEFKGLETVRSDWTPLAREFQYDLFYRFFHEKELKQWIKNFVTDLRAGEFDHKLVYKKRLSRKVGDYAKNRPPHVRAALLLDPKDKKNLREISYLMTAEGPVPQELYKGGADYHHYVEKQIKPIADAVLFALGEDFDSLIEGRQLNLF